MSDHTLNTPNHVLKYTNEYDENSEEYIPLYFAQGLPSGIGCVSEESSPPSFSDAIGKLNLVIPTYSNTKKRKLLEYTSNSDFESKDKTKNNINFENQNEINSRFAKKTKQLNNDSFAISPNFYSNTTTLSGGNLIDNTPDTNFSPSNSFSNLNSLHMNLLLKPQKEVISISSINNVNVNDSTLSSNSENIIDSLSEGSVSSSNNNETLLIDLTDDGSNKKRKKLSIFLDNNDSLSIQNGQTDSSSDLQYSVKISTENLQIPHQNPSHYGNYNNMLDQDKDNNTMYNNPKIKENNLIPNESNFQENYLNKKEILDIDETSDINHIELNGSLQNLPIEDTSVDDKPIITINVDDSSDDDLDDEIPPVNQKIKEEIYSPTLSPKNFYRPPTPIPSFDETSGLKDEIQKSPLKSDNEKSENMSELFNSDSNSLNSNLFKSGSNSPQNNLSDLDLNSFQSILPNTEFNSSTPVHSSTSGELDKMKTPIKNDGHIPLCDTPSLDKNINQNNNPPNEAKSIKIRRPRFLENVPFLDLPWSIFKALRRKTIEEESTQETDEEKEKILQEKYNNESFNYIKILEPREAMQELKLTINVGYCDPFIREFAKYCAPPIGEFKAEEHAFISACIPVEMSHFRLFDRPDHTPDSKYNAALEKANQISNYLLDIKKKLPFPSVENLSTVKYHSDRFAGVEYAKIGLHTRGEANSLAQIDAEEAFTSLLSGKKIKPHDVRLGGRGKLTHVKGGVNINKYDTDGPAVGRLILMTSQRDLKINGVTEQLLTKAYSNARFPLAIGLSWYHGNARKFINRMSPYEKYFCLDAKKFDSSINPWMIDLGIKIVRAQFENGFDPIYDTYWWFVKESLIYAPVYRDDGKRYKKFVGTSSGHSHNSLLQSIITLTLAYAVMCILHPEATIQEIMRDVWIEALGDDNIIATRGKFSKHDKNEISQTMFDAFQIDWSGSKSFVTTTLCDHKYGDFKGVQFLGKYFYYSPVQNKNKYGTRENLEPLPYRPAIDNFLKLYFPEHGKHESLEHTYLRLLGNYFDAAGNHEMENWINMALDFLDDREIFPPDEWPKKYKELFTRDYSKMGNKVPRPKRITYDQWHDLVTLPVYKYVDKYPGDILQNDMATSSEVSNTSFHDEENEFNTTEEAFPISSEHIQNNQKSSDDNSLVDKNSDIDCIIIDYSDNDNGEDITSIKLSDERDKIFNQSSEDFKSGKMCRDEKEGLKGKFDLDNSINHMFASVSPDLEDDYDEKKDYIVESSFKHNESADGFIRKDHKGTDISKKDKYLSLSDSDDEVSGSFAYSNDESDEENYEDDYADGEDGTDEQEEEEEGKEEREEEREAREEEKEEREEEEEEEEERKEEEEKEEEDQEIQDNQEGHKVQDQEHEYKNENKNEDEDDKKYEYDDDEDELLKVDSPIIIDDEIITEKTTGMNVESSFDSTNSNGNENKFLFSTNPFA